MNIFWVIVPKFQHLFVYTGVNANFLVGFLHERACLPIFPCRHAIGGKFLAHVKTYCETILHTICCSFFPSLALLSPHLLDANLASTRCQPPHCHQVCSMAPSGCLVNKTPSWKYQYIWYSPRCPSGASWRFNKWRLQSPYQGFGSQWWILVG